MERFKIEYFQEENPGQSFPKFRTLNAIETEQIQVKLRGLLSLDRTSDLLAIVNAVESRTSYIEGIDAENEDFDLGKFLHSENIVPERSVYLNWYRFDEIDQLDLRDLTTHFHDIWYPSSDDIDVFDSTFRWIVSIRHDGVPGVTRFNDDGNHPEVSLLPGC